MDSSNDLRTTIYNNMLDLATSEGINASGRDEVFGCIFGRDSFITILKLLKVYQNQSDKNDLDVIPLREICKKSLLTLITLQGKEINLESGEEPGKFIHEYRKDKYEPLVNRPRPWYVYPDKILRNYDSIDSTPLGLIAIYKYWKATGDNEFLLTALPAVEKAINWMLTYGDSDHDYLLEYELHKDRVHGGLVVQSWTDSRESLTQSDGKFPLYPIAPVEVQGYAWLALKLWADYYSNTTNFPPTIELAGKLENYIAGMEKRFNEMFIFQSEGFNFLAQALDGDKNQIRTVTGNPLLLLWATYFKDGVPQTIVDKKYIPDLIKRSFMADMFEHDAGIRTMSLLSTTYNPNPDSYHNGSFWPVLNGMCHEGLANWGYKEEAGKLKSATLKPIEFFATPIELYAKNKEGGYIPYETSYGKTSCRNQAWTAAVALDLLTI